LPIPVIFVGLSDSFFGVLSAKQQDFSNTFICRVSTPFYFREIFPSTLSFLVFCHCLLGHRLMSGPKVVRGCCEECVVFSLFFDILGLVSADK